MSKNTGMIFDIKRFAVRDGPGIRTTVFLKGCPLSCWWCHNPEGIYDKKEIIFYDYKCMDCGKCIDICPQNAILKIGTNYLRNYNICISCGQCVEICPTGSQQSIGQEITVKDIIKNIEKDIIYFESSSGGVTFSGGEPIMQPVFLKETLKICKKMHIHTALDTSGYANRGIFNSISNDIDLFLYDLKIIDNLHHKKYTGVSNKLIIKNLETLVKKRKNVVLRFSLIPGITATEENIKNILSFISTLKGIDKIDILPFHNVKEKYIRIGKKYKMNDTKSLNVDEINNVKEQFEQRGFNVKIGG